jgi:hypothetical protein
MTDTSIPDKFNMEDLTNEILTLTQSIEQLETIVESKKSSLNQAKTMAKLLQTEYYASLELARFYRDLLNSHGLEIEVMHLSISFRVPGSFNKKCIICKYHSNVTSLIIPLIKLCPNLSIFKASFRNSITHLHIRELARNCPKLTEIDIHRCDEITITDESMEALAIGCPMLKTIHISLCKSLTNRSVFAIANKCPNLRYFELEFNNNFTDECILSLAKNCPKLEFIYFIGFGKITDESVRAVWQSCPNIRYIEVKYCPNISQVLIKDLEKMQRV